MFTSLVKIALVSVAVASIASSALAEDAAAPTGQNAFTQMIQKSLADIVTAVPNPKTAMCNGVVDCREKSGDLATVWQLSHTTDLSPKDYPQRCYVPGDNGKYVYSAATC